LSPKVNFTNIFCVKADWYLGENIFSFLWQLLAKMHQNVALGDEAVA
jgi:hypothetical protein